ncbi:MAG TPA: protocatechuate 3,4-dioxygenase [Alphaproteobacteria bacterium]
MTRLSRRRLIGALAAGGALAGAAPVRAASCLLTPDQATGPFYPVAFGESDADLTRVAGASLRAEGKVIEVTGAVLGADCRPLAGAVIELWQANAAGRYAHPREAGNARALDPGFQGAARLTAGADGAYRLVTIKPGAYPATGSWWRPPHIHFRVVAPDGHAFVTQMYFAGEELNEADRLYGSIPVELRDRVTVAFDARADGVAAGQFDIVLG